MSARIDKRSNLAVWAKWRETRHLFSAHLFVALVQVARACICATFTCLPWLIRYSAYIGDRQPLEAHKIIYTGHFGAPHHFKSEVFDYYRLCAINWQFLDAVPDCRSQFGVTFFSHSILTFFFLLLKLDNILIELSSHCNGARIGSDW